jgi:hypothetical protein
VSSFFHAITLRARKLDPKVRSLLEVKILELLVNAENIDNHVVFAFCVVVSFYHTCLVTITINDKSCLKFICSYVPCTTLLAARWVISLSLSSHSLAIQVHVTINVAPQKKL